MNRRTLILIGACAALLTLPARRASAWDVEINAETIGQGYQLVAGNGDLVSRRRLDQYLGLNVWNIGKKDSFGQPLRDNQFYFTSSMRLSFDFGDYLLGTPTIGGRNVAPELGNNRFDLLFFYFGGRDVGGFIDFKVGRQIEYSLFELLSFDGLSVEAKTPWWFAVSAYGGLLVNGFLPIDSAIYRPDGTAPGVLSPHDMDPKPVVGAGVRAIGFRDLDASFGYRRVFSPGTDLGCTLGSTDLRTIESCTKATSGTTEEVLAWQARYRILDGLIIPWAGFRYNLLVDRLDVIEAGASFNISPKHALRAEYVYSYPTFDGDSIWNLFARSQFDDVRVGYDLRLGRFRGWARALVRIFHDINGGPDFSPAGSVDGGGSLGGRVDLKQGFLRADLYGELGYGGTKVGVDLSGRFKVWRDILGLEGRLTYVHFEDDHHTSNYADSFGFQVGARVSFWKGMLLHLIFEDNINRFDLSQIRFYALLDVTALVGGYGFMAGSPRGIGPGMGQYGGAYGTGMGY